MGETSRPKETHVHRIIVEASPRTTYTANRVYRWLHPARTKARSAVYLLLPLLWAFAVAACGGASPAPARAPEASSPPSEDVPAAVAAAPDAPSEEAEAGPAAAAPPQKRDGVKIAGDGSDAPITLNDSKNAGDARGAAPSKIKPTKTEAAMRFFVIDKGKGQPIPGVVISMTDPEGKKFYTGETDAKGYGEVLVPVGKTYELEYLSLGRRNISAKVPVPEGANQNIKLTLRYKRFDAAGRVMLVEGPPPPQVFVLAGVNFDTAKATIRPESFPRLDRVLEYLTYKQGSRIEISGHTDNVGKPEANKDLSQRRADACKKYLVDRGIDASRIETVGYGAEKPVAPNDTPGGRQRNRRIEAREL